MPLSEFPRPADDSTGNDRPAIRTPPPGPMSRSAAARLEAVECPAFLRRRQAQSGEDDGTPIVLATGFGSNLYDVDANRYVDLVAGFGALLLGHGATPVVRAIEAQAERLIQALGDVYVADAKIALLERLVALHPNRDAHPRALLTQSGSDAVTAAIKTATLATGRPGLVAFEGGYHGLGYAPLAACGLRAGYREPFAAQLNPNTAFVAYPRAETELAGTLDRIEAALKPGDKAAVLVEPILGRGGCIVPPAGFLRQLGELAHRHGALLIADEIWTGLGRSGHMLRSTVDGAAVDILCFGKGLGGGVPIAACVASDAIMQAWSREPEVVHTSTHAGAPLACAAAVATLDTLRFRQLPARAQEIGERTIAFMTSELRASAGVVAVRGEGLMIGVELDTPERAARTTRRLLEAGYLSLTGGARGEVVTWTPALTIDEELLRDAAIALREALS